MEIQLRAIPLCRRRRLRVYRRTRQAARVCKIFRKHERVLRYLLQRPCLARFRKHGDHCGRPHRDPHLYGRQADKDPRKARHHGEHDYDLRVGIFDEHHRRRKPHLHHLEKRQHGDGEQAAPLFRSGEQLSDRDRAFGNAVHGDGYRRRSMHLHHECGRQPRLDREFVRQKGRFHLRRSRRPIHKGSRTKRSLRPAHLYPDIQRQRDGRQDRQIFFFGKRRGHRAAVYVCEQRHGSVLV